jgi:serine/threonine protein kinase
VYTLHEELGAGAFGTTYLASDTKNGEVVACKVIAKRKVLDAEDREVGLALCASVIYFAVKTRVDDGQCDETNLTRE